MSPSRVVVGSIACILLGSGCVRGPKEFVSELNRENCRLLVCAFGSDPDVFCGADRTGTAALVDDAIADGRRGYDADEARACLVALAVLGDAMCVGNPRVEMPSGSSIASCELALVPLVADGGFCTDDDECLSLNCTTAGNACGGTCATGLRDGATGCDSSTDCAWGFWCDGGFQGNGTCRAATAAEGACSSGETCAPGLNCVGGKCVKNAAPAGSGALDAACADTDECGEGLWCSSGKCTSRKAPGAPCTTPSLGGPVAECSGYSTCKGVGLFGGESGTCLPLKSSGEACTRDGDSHDCRGGLKCDTASNTCVRAKNVGDACSEEDTCGLPLVCVKSKCAEASGEGQACDSEQVCFDGYRCTEGKCALAVCNPA